MHSTVTKLYDYVVQPMTADDLEQVVELEREARLSLWGHDGYAEEMRRVEAITLAARGVRGGAVTSELLGFVAARLNADELHINNIAVHEDWRGRGLGRTLLARALAEGKRIGAAWSVLEVRASNDLARALYARAGFEVVGRRRDYYRDPPEDATVMSLRL